MPWLVHAASAVVAQRSAVVRAAFAGGRMGLLVGGGDEVEGHAIRTPSRPNNLACRSYMTTVPAEATFRQ